MKSGIGEIIYIIVAVYIYIRYIKSYSRQREKELRKRCEVCGTIIPYVAKICPCCHQDPGCDLNIDNSALFSGRAGTIGAGYHTQQQLSRVKKTRKRSAGKWFLIIYPIVAFYIYCNLFGNL